MKRVPLLRCVNAGAAKLFGAAEVVLVASVEVTLVLKELDGFLDSGVRKQRLELSKDLV